MNDTYRDKTRVSFGPVEAYARRHLRVAGVIGEAITLSLQDAIEKQRVASPLLNLTEGTGLEIGHLSLVTVDRDGRLGLVANIDRRPLGTGDRLRRHPRGAVDERPKGVGGRNS
ncbi:hypothetical protein [Paraburkholderia tuberum]|uniref:Uncharacterized protein n=1 Tax=Paraburkholderia tuberum TaxID=157910 RepID=A0A1H1KHQ3_9BURK|nr:hypothetical protein [Paraburkholderia tuberum]SDR61868.1 hypothetical protein SAMN05445850_8013 [Paraburkholderia tuberum]